MTQGNIEKTETDGYLKNRLCNLIETTAVESGDWVQNSFTKTASLQIETATTGDPEEVAFSLSIHGSNASEKPSRTEDGVKIGSDITESGLIAFTTPCRWVKAKVASLTGEEGEETSVTVRLHQIY